MEVYAIYSGSRYEGGSVDAICLTKEKALEEAEKFFHKEQAHTHRIHKDKVRWQWKEVERELWWHEDLIKMYQNPVSEIRVIRYKVIE